MPEDVVFLAKMVVVSFAGRAGSVGGARTPCSALLQQCVQGVSLGGSAQPAALFYAWDAGGAVIKYGSLLSDIPFEPSPTLAVSLVLGTPVLYALYLLSRGEERI